MRWHARLQRPRAMGMLMLLLLAALQLFAETPAQSWLRNAWFDACQTMMPRQRISAPAVIVAVDEKSLAQLGQWPWPRTLLAQLLDSIARYRPLAVGVDIIFAEPDQLSPGKVAERSPQIGPALTRQLSRLPSNDEVLAAAISRLPVVLGIAGTEQPAGPGAQPRPAAVFLMRGDPQPHLRNFPSALTSIEQIDAAATSRALLNADARDGVVRRIPLIAAVGGAPFPSLSLETLRVGVKEQAISVRSSAGGVESVGIGDVVVPVEDDGHLWVRFSPHDPARFVSAADVIAGTLDREQIAGKLVLLGVTGIGLLDLQITPLGERVPGVEIHSQVLENIFDGNLLGRPRWLLWTETAFLLLFGAVLVLAVPRISALHSTVLLTAGVAVLFLLGLALFRYSGLLFDAAAPAIGINILFGGLLRSTLAESARQQARLTRELAVEREAAARMAGELEAARRVQMGMLPVAALAFWDERRFELHAVMEPAKEVGGDLYDFFMLDDARLFIMVGDVSGKGLPASIFMALSKALYKSAVLRRLPDLGQTMAEANIEISRDNPELMFVTVLACVLDVNTGEVQYCNAGHEPARAVAAAGKEVKRLEGGGPPLCTLEHFPYATERYRMSPGESLVLLSDGVPEGMNVAGELFGRARLGEVLAAMPGGATAEERVKIVNDEIRAFSAGTSMADDVTILVVRWHGPTNQ